MGCIQHYRSRVMAIEEATIIVDHLAPELTADEFECPLDAGVPAYYSDVDLTSPTSVHLPHADPDDLTDISDVDCRATLDPSVANGDVHRVKGPFRRLLKSRIRHHIHGPPGFDAQQLNITNTHQGSMVEQAMWSKGHQPMLHLRVLSHAEEQGHTQYSIQCTLVARDIPVLEWVDSLPIFEWVVKKRLKQIRNGIHQLVKRELGSKQYTRRFGSARFARFFGPPGTTARLNGWCRALEDCVRDEVLTQCTLMAVLVFLEAPPMSLTHVHECVSDTKM